MSGLTSAVETTTPSAPPSGSYRLYPTAAGWTAMNSAGNTYLLGQIDGMTAGYVAFGGATTPLAADASLYWDNTNKRLGVGTSSPAGDVDVLRDQDAPTYIQVTNTTNSASAIARVVARSSGTFGAVLFSAPSNYTGITEFAGKVGIYTFSTNGNLVLAARAATGGIDFYTGGSAAANKTMTLSSAGSLSVGGGLNVGTASGAGIGAIFAKSSASATAWPTAGVGNFELAGRFTSATANNGVDIGGSATTGDAIITPSGTNKTVRFGVWTGAAYLETMSILNTGAVYVGATSGGSGILNTGANLDVGSNLTGAKAILIRPLEATVPAVINFRHGGVDKWIIGTNVGYRTQDSAATFQIGTGATEYFTVSTSGISTNAGADYFTYATGSWTPAFTNLTEAGGSATKTGKWVRIGKMVWFNIIIVPVTSTSSTAGTTYCNNMPFTAGATGTGMCSDSANNNLGPCVVPATVAWCLTGTWTASGREIRISGVYST